MINLIKSEVYKLTHSKVFRNCNIVMVIMTFITGFSRIIFGENGKLYLLHKGMNYRQYGFTINCMKELVPIEYLYNALGSIAVMLIVSIFIVGFSVINEYESGTVRNSIAYGHSRISVYFSKLIGIGIVVASMTTIYIIISMICSSLSYGWGNLVTNEIISVILMVNIALMAIVSVNICTAFIIKSKPLLVVLLMGVISITFIRLKNPISGLFSFNPFFILMDVCAEIPSMELMRTYTINTSMLVVISSVIGIAWFKNQDVK